MSANSERASMEHVLKLAVLWVLGVGEITAFFGYLIPLSPEQAQWGWLVAWSAWTFVVWMPWRSVARLVNTMSRRSPRTWG